MHSDRFTHIGIVHLYFKGLAVKSYKMKYFIYLLDNLSWMQNAHFNRYGVFYTQTVIKIVEYFDLCIRALFTSNTAQLYETYFNTIMPEQIN